MSTEYRERTRSLLPHKLREVDNAKQFKKIIDILSDFVEQDRELNVKYNGLISVYDLTGVELDLYGDMFSCYREDGEDDDTFRDRIILQVVLRKTGNTIPAIQQVITQFVPEGNVKIQENHMGSPASCYLTGNTTTDVFNFIFGFVRDLVPAGVRLFVPVALLGTWQDLWDAADLWENVASDRFIW